jgi:RNA recognition motif-containing protein
MFGAVREPSRGSASRGSKKEKETIPMKKIYVGNLPFSATEDQLRQMFGQHGSVESVALITDRTTGQPRGFGFVEMSPSDADKAIQALRPEPRRSFAALVDGYSFSAERKRGVSLKGAISDDRSRGACGGMRRAEGNL